MSEISPWSARQRAEVSIRVGRRGALRASVEITPVGLLAIGAMVSAMLLSSAAIVDAALRHRRPR
jgi:hypothetical protein